MIAGNAGQVFYVLQDKACLALSIVLNNLVLFHCMPNVNTVLVTCAALESGGWVAGDLSLLIVRFTWEPVWLKLPKCEHQIFGTKSLLSCPSVSSMAESLELSKQMSVNSAMNSAMFKLRSLIRMAIAKERHEGFPIIGKVCLQTCM
jgi:hypothetical protein